MQHKIDTAIAEIVGRIPIDQIPFVLVLLAERLQAQGNGGYPSANQDYSGAQDGAKILLTANQLAERLNLPESWLRNEERLGRIPSLRAGKYVRFNLSEVERSLAERKRDGS